MSSEGKDRRSILRIVVSTGLGVLGATLAGLLGLVAAPAEPETGRRWRKAASIFDLPPDEPMAAVLAERGNDGWYATSRQTAIFIDREGEGYRALSATCRHLGCRVHWDQRKQQFLCPCHGGVYDREGRVVAGPPPRPLERLSVRVNAKTADIEVEL